MMNADHPQNVLRLNPENPVFVCQNRTGGMELYLSLSLPGTPLLPLL